MAYAQALEKAWQDVLPALGNKRLSLKLLADTYDIDIEKKTVFSASCNIPAKEYTSIILLHYLVRRHRNDRPFILTGEWIDFNQLPGGPEYYPTFRKRTIDRVIKKYGGSSSGLSEVAERFPAKSGSVGDSSIVIYPFDDVPIMLTLWRADEEFGADANILFDKSIKEIFCTEDIVVLTEIVVHSL